MNVGGCDVRETLWTATYRFALAPRERDKAMMLSQLTFRESESFDQGRCSEGGVCLIGLVPLFAWHPFLFSLSGSHSLSRLVMILALAKRSNHSRGDGSGRMEDGEEEEGKGLVMWFCVGQDCPPF